MSHTLSTRAMKNDDVDAITDIDARTDGVMRRAFWADKVLIQETSRPPWTSLVAEYDGEVVGFLFCHYSELEFGLPGKTAWIDILGVHTGYRRLGVAATMIEDFTYSAEDVGIDRIFTLVSETDHPEVETFFSSQGFAEGRMKHFRKDLKPNDG
jgi:ribosomal protein S18 acetylase RimI-like enzyme